MGQPDTHLHDNDPHRHDTVESGKASARVATLEVTGDADETVPLLPRAADESDEGSGLNGNLELPKQTVQASVCRFG